MTIQLQRNNHKDNNINILLPFSTKNATGDGLPLSEEDDSVLQQSGINDESSEPAVQVVGDKDSS